MVGSMEVSASHASDLQNLPHLPGYNYPLFKENYHKPQTWGIVNGQRIEQREGLSHDKTKFVKGRKEPENWRSGSLPDSTTRAIFKNPGQEKEHVELPAWDALDRHVLRFHGYFKEAVAESNLENYRVRRVVFFYYLEDDTCHIIEPRQDNSGIPQGQLVRRHRFPAPEGRYIMPEDLRVGFDVHVYGKTIHLTDCDPFTREYYTRLNMEQEPAEEAEADPFFATRESTKVKEAKPPRNYEKVYREVMLGGGHINADMQQFLENDRRVLRFFAVMDDLKTPQFERRPFTILFFLADDTVEIREQYPLNCGRDNFPIFFQRKKMPIGDVRVDGPQSQPRKKWEYVDGRDLFVGQHCTLMNNHYYIYDADEFTREYFKRELNIDLEEKKMVELPERAVPRAQTPPYNGYGTWDDSMGSVLHLIPKPPKKDFNKLFHNDGKILRFTAKFVDPKPEDTDRLFVINYHLFDDTLSIHEPPQRNLGIVTGRFLEKAVHMNQETGELFKPEDFLPGNVISVFNHKFETLDMDEYTRNYLSDPDGAKRPFNLESVLEKLRESMRQQFPLVRDIFRRFDIDHDGVITIGEFKKGLEKFGFQLAPEEVLIVMRHFDTRKDGQVSYNEFCDAVLDEDWTRGMMNVKIPLNQTFDANYADKSHRKLIEREETARVRKAVREISDCLYKHTHVMHKLLKEIEHMSHLPHISLQQLQYAFAQIGFVFDMVDVERAVCFMLPGVNLDVIPYHDFLKGCQLSYHDLHKIR